MPLDDGERRDDLRLLLQRERAGERLLGGLLRDEELVLDEPEGPIGLVPPRDVVPAVEEYLEEARRAGFKALRIIHGRGIGAQREVVRRILAAAPFVADFRDAPAEAGGWGATVVTLL